MSENLDNKLKNLSMGVFDYFNNASVKIVQTFCSVLLSNITKNHDALFERLGDYSRAKYLIKPNKFAYQFLLQPLNIRPIIKVYPYSKTNIKADAEISASFESLIKLVNGTLDGDALFFSREINVSGDTDALVALRNAIDSSELDIEGEFYKLFGVFKNPAKILTNGMLVAFDNFKYLKNRQNGWFKTSRN